MSKASHRFGALVALVVAGVLAGCETPPEPVVIPPPPPPPPLALNQGIADAASIYVAFMRQVQTIQPGGFADAESIQASIRTGASYEPGQLSRGMIAYGAVLALQSPEFVAGVRQYAADPSTREALINRIITDPANAATLPGADAAAGLIAQGIGADSARMLAIAEGVEGDAYTIQERQDPRRRWAVTPIPNREVRLEGAKTLSANVMLPSAEDAARLNAAAHAGTGLGIASGRASAPYTPAVTRSLAIAALAALGAGGDTDRTTTDALTSDTTSEFCLNLSKLMLYQCLAASRPSYEDMFCLGRHVARDLATCTAQNMAPTPVAPVTLSVPEVEQTPVSTAN